MHAHIENAPSSPTVCVPRNMHVRPVALEINMINVHTGRNTLIEHFKQAFELSQ